MKAWVSKHTAKLRYHLVYKLIQHTTVGFYEKIIQCVTPSLHKKLRFPRPMIEFLHQRFLDKPLKGVEIGVASGEHARCILETLNMETLFLVDPYVPYVQDGGLWANYVHALPRARALLRGFRDRVVFVHKRSVDALNDVPDDLDFVYIDGNHSYDFVKDDIENYYPKIKGGGVLGGHDFSLDYRGVVKAVTDFADTHDLGLSGSRRDWWITKK